MTADDDGLRTPKYWRDRAEEARTRAGEMTDVGARNLMLNIAESYERMAERAENRSRQPKGQH